MFRFTEGSLRRALDAGRSVEQVLSYLEQHAVHGVPQALDYVVRDLGRRHGHVRVGALGSFCRCDDEVLVKVLLNDKRLAALRLRELVPGLLGADAAPTDLVDRLRAAGYLPVHEGVDGAVVPTRPVATRTAPVPQRAVAEVDVAALAARIVAAVPAVQSPLSPASQGEWCEECGCVHVVGDELDRPVETEHDLLRIAELLDNADYFGWPVELTYDSRTVVGWAGEVDSGRIAFETAGGGELTFALSAVTALRVLSEGEESRIL